MGSWKSTVGRSLAKAMDMEFVDIDDEIEEITKMKISEIFKEFGEKKFREMETAFFSEKSKKNGQVFSTGGGIVLDNKNRKILINNGIAFFLNASASTLENRLHNTSKRPLLAKENNIKDRLGKIWDERKGLYEKSSHYCIETDNLNPKMVLGKILNILELPFENY